MNKKWVPLSTIFLQGVFCHCHEILCSRVVGCGIFGDLVTSRPLRIGFGVRVIRWGSLLFLLVIFSHSPSRLAVSHTVDLWLALLHYVVTLRVRLHVYTNS